MTAQLAKFLIFVGILLIIVGLAILYYDKVPFIRWLGSLPGDIRIERENFKFYFPLTTSILLSIVFSILFWFFTGRGH